MKSHESLNHLTALVESQCNEVASAAITMLEISSGEDVQQKRQASQKLVNELNWLLNLAPQSQVPSWLPQLKGVLTAFNSGQCKAANVVQELFKVLPLIQNQKWALGDAVFQPDGFDFEEIFVACRDASRVPDLFDSIISLLGQIRDSGEIDSRNMHEALVKVIASLEVGKTSSFFSLEGSWHFLCSFLENYFWAEVESLPGVGSVIEALRKTVADTREELEKMTATVNVSMKEKVAEDVRLFRNSPIPSLGTYSARGHYLEQRPDEGTSVVV